MRDTGKSFWNIKTIIAAVVLAAAAAALIVTMIIMNSPKELTASEHIANAEEFMESEDYSKAASAYIKALELEPENLKALYGEACAYRLLGNNDKAKELLDGAVNIARDRYSADKTVSEETRDIYYTYADILVESGSIQEAYDMLESASDMINDIIDKYDNETFKNDPLIAVTGEAQMNENGHLMFGRYPQTEVSGDSLTEAITGAVYTDNRAIVDGNIYVRTEINTDYRYFQCEPIEWRILKEDDNGYLVMSEYGLDTRQYNERYTDISWAECSLRQWLNEDFYSQAFVDKEQDNILTLKLTASYNVYYPNVEMIDVDTENKVGLLSITEVNGGEFGYFDLDPLRKSELRVCHATEYAQAVGTYITQSESCLWWVRTNGYDLRTALFVGEFGGASADGAMVNATGMAVRPVIYISKTAVTQ